jgi:hypothetical protein
MISRLEKIDEEEKESESSSDIEVDIENPSSFL